MFRNIRYMLFYPKIGPDMYLTHWLLFYKPLRIFFQNRKLLRIGKNSEVRPYSTIIGTNNVIIGDNVVIQPGTILGTNPSDSSAQIIIEDDVLFGPNIAVYCATHNYRDPSRPIKQQGHTSKTTILKRGCWIGINAVVLPGVTIGKNSVVGANSVVTRDIPDFAVAVGAPARVIRYINRTS